MVRFSRSCSRSLWLPGLFGRGFVLVGAGSVSVSVPVSSVPAWVAVVRSRSLWCGLGASCSLRGLRGLLASARSFARSSRLCRGCPGVSCSCCSLGGVLPSVRWLPAVRGCVALVAVSALWAWRGFGGGCVVVRSVAVVSWRSFLRPGVAVRSVPAPLLRVCRPAALGGRRGLFGAPGLLGALCSPWPLSPVSRRVVLWAVSCLVWAPGVACSFFSSVPAPVLASWRSVLASALGCPAPLSSGLRVRAWCSVVSRGLVVPFPSALGGGCLPVASGLSGVRGVVASWWPVARAVASVVSSACAFLRSGALPVGGLSPRRPVLARLLGCLSWFVRG